jgi:hypothetical protein
MILTEHPKFTVSQLLLLEGTGHPGHSINNNDNAFSPAATHPNSDRNRRCLASLIYLLLALSLRRGRLYYYFCCEQCRGRVSMAEYLQKPRISFAKLI